MEVADVRAGRTGVDEIAERIEEHIGIVVGEKRFGVEAARCRPRRRRRVGDRPRGVGGTVVDALIENDCTPPS